MNDFQKNSLKKYLENYNLFAYLLQNTEKRSDEELVRLLQDNHSMARSMLIDLGVTFKEIDTIRSLNERIRELEASQGNTDVNYDTVSIFIKQITEKVKKDFSDMGVYAGYDVSMTPNLFINVRFYSSGNNTGSRSSFRSEESLNAYNQSKLEEHQRFMANFETVARGTDGFFLAYTNSNLAVLKGCLEKSLGVEIGDLSVVVDNTYEGEKPNHKVIPYISEVHFKFWTLPSSRSFNDAMKNRY